jgi:N-acyl-D-aspartate/D-glutamate deacylase
LVYDLVIKNGHVIDGTGRPRFKANVYVEDGKLSNISSDGPEFGEKVIDAEGMIVSPGFIDMHSHSDLTIFGNRRAESMIRQGVTTVYFTPDGWSPAPIVDMHREDLREYYETLTFGSPPPFNWTTYEEYFNSLEEGGLGVNVRANVGFGTVRINVMGFDDRDPTREELERMKELIDQAFRDGVCGMSTGLTYHPQSYSTTQEVLELCEIVSKHGGIYHTHTRGGTEGMREALEISERSSVPVQLTHTTPSNEQIDIIEDASARGVDVMFDAYPYTAGSTFLSARLRGWVHEGGREDLLQRIMMQDVREKIWNDWKEVSADRWPNGRRGLPLIAWCQNERCRKYEGKTMNEISDMMDVDIVDAYCSLLLENKGNVMFLSLHSRLHEDVKRAFQHRLMLVGSDSWAMAPYGPLHIGYPHPRCYGTFPKILGRYVRQMGLLTLEEAIKKMTFASARRMLITDRGALRKGMAADITIFDPETVIDNATYENPHQYPLGIEYVVVNGKVTIKKDEHTGVLAGKALRYRSKAEQQNNT